MCAFLGFLCILCSWYLSTCADSLLSFGGRVAIPITAFNAHLMFQFLVRSVLMSMGLLVYVQIFTSKNDASEDESKSKGTQAKELLARYGGAYLATSISLSAISFGLCYVLVSSGIDVASLLQKIGIQSNETGEKVGTFALAYAAHKAASPIRFPPTVALTPVVASWFGKKGTETKEEEKL